MCARLCLIRVVRIKMETKLETEVRKHAMALVPNATRFLKRLVQLAICEFRLGIMVHAYTDYSTRVLVSWRTYQHNP